LNHTYGHIAILGAGESGMGAAQLAALVGVRAFLSEYGSLSASDKALLEQWGVEYEEGEHTLERILAADGVIKSPGIKHTTPVVKAVKAAGVPLMGEVDWATLYTAAPIVAVTGSNGKTTTATLCHHIISGEKDCVLAGNIGLSLGRALAERMEANAGDPEVIVLEVSSFQLDDAHHLSPTIGILTNITPGPPRPLQLQHRRIRCKQVADARIHQKRGLLPLLRRRSHHHGTSRASPRKRNTPEHDGLRHSRIRKRIPQSKRIEQHHRNNYKQRSNDN
jgi:hypothetical protein